MARPRSEEKQIALLEAATEIVATQGLGAPTSQIAKRAGVAEGTLFRYFPTKDDLLNELYLHLIQNLNEALVQSLDETAPLMDRTRALWNNFIDWGIANPTANSAMNQLAISEKIRADTHDSAMQLCTDMYGTDICTLFLSEENISANYVDAIMTALAQVTVTFAAANPDKAEAYKDVGFKVMWQGFART